MEFSTSAREVLVALVVVGVLVAMYLVAVYLWRGGDGPGGSGRQR